MPQYVVAAPDGTKYNVTAPDGASQDEIMRMVQAQHGGAQSKPDVGTVVPGAGGGFGGQVDRGSTFGASDMIRGATGATLDTLADTFEGKKGAPSWHDYYDAALARSRDAGDKYAEEHPTLSTVGQTIGGFASMKGAVPKGPQTVGTLMNTALKSAGYGAAIGGTQGFISGRGGFENRAINAAVGGGAGAAIGFATPFAVAGGKAVYSAGKAALTGALPDSAVNQTVDSAIGQLGDRNSDASKAMLDRLEQAKGQASKVWKNTMASAGVDETTPIATGDLKTSMKTFLGSLTRSERSEIPGDVTSIFDDFGTHEPLKEIQDWRSKIATAGRQASRAGNGNAARILGDLSDHVENFVADIPTKSGNLTPDQVSAYEGARQGWKQFKQTFAQQGSPVTTALSQREFGNAAESNTANLFVRKGAGAPEALESYLKAVGTDPQALQAGRDAFAQKFMESAQTGVDQAGQPIFSPSGVRKFLDNYSHVADSRLFTTDQRALMSRIGDVADLSKAPSGSRRLVDQVVRKLAPGVAGYAGFHVGGIPGMLAGATLGVGANNVMTAIEQAPRDAAVRLLGASINSPALAKILTGPATATAAKNIPAPLQAQIYGILSGRTGAGLARLSAPQPSPQPQ